MSGSDPAVPHGGLEVKNAHQGIDALIEDADADVDGLKRSIGPLNLMSIGVAAVVGAGIFVVTGAAAAEHAGPAVIVSFVIAAGAAALSALCYAELAGMIPVAGSTYSYAYASMGTLIAWIIGWDLLLEYLFGAASVASGWSGYFTSFLDAVGIHVPYDLRTALVSEGEVSGGLINLPAVLLVALVTILLLVGTKLSAGATTAFVGVKIFTLLIFVVVGLTAINVDNFFPFLPPNNGNFGEFGWSGVIAAAGMVFYSFIAFDAVCTAAQEARHPRRTIPIGVLGSLAIATVLYVVVGAVVVGLTPYSNLNTADPLSVALTNANLVWVANIVDIGAVVGLAASVLALLFAQTRILMRMSEDGMLPTIFQRVNPARGTPVGSVLICGILCAIMTGLLPASILTALISIGTLLAFIIVSLAVLILRKTRPDLPRKFRVPGGPTIPILSMIVSLGIMATLPLDTWIRLMVWLLIGLVIFFAYSRSRAEAVIEARAVRSAKERIDRAAGLDPNIPQPDPEAM